MQMWRWIITTQAWLISGTVAPKNRLSSCLLRCVLDHIGGLSVLRDQRWLHHFWRMLILRWTVHFGHTSLLWRLLIVCSFHLMQHFPLELLLVGLGVEARFWCTLTYRSLSHSSFAVYLIDILTVLLSLLLTVFAIATLFAFRWVIMPAIHILAYFDDSESLDSTS